MVVKATQKMSRQAKKQPIYWSNKRILFVMLGALLLFVFVTIGYFKTAQYIDAKKFADAEQTQKQITQELVKSLGSSVVSVQANNECFNTEQGPYDNGRLWCQTASVIKLSDDVAYNQLKTVFINNAPQGASVSNSVDNLPTSSFTLSDGLYCSIDLRNADGKIYGNARTLPFDFNEKNVASISCAARAKAKHYPFTK